MLRRVARLVPSTLSRQIQRGFCISSSSSKSINNKTIDERLNSEEGSQQQPKWMKFFSGQEPMQIDLDRSMKSENVELIQTHIKTNYPRFNDDQLVMVLPKISRSLLVDKVKAEIRSRILAGTFQLSIESWCKLIEYLEDINQNDRLIVMYVLATVSEEVQHLTHVQSFRLVHLALRANKISYPIARNFLDLIAAFNPKEIVEIFANFDHQSATNYMLTLAELHKILEEDILSTSTMESIIDAYMNKVNEFVDLNEAAAQIHLDRIFNPEVLRLFNPQRKLEYKKLAIKAIELRFDSERNLGKFSYIKGDKGVTIQKALGLLRSIVHSNERSLVEKCLILIGNAILDRDTNDFKFDFRLFTYLAKYNYAYKFYVDESFISMKSLLRSLRQSSKKSFSEEQDYNSYNLLFTKSKTYTDLNYGAIIKKSEDVYSRKVDFSDSMQNQWNQFQRDLQECLKDYLQLQISTNMFEKILTRIPDRSEIDSLDEQESDAQTSLESNESEDSSVGALEKRSEELRALKQGETYASDWMQYDRDAVEGSLDNAASPQFKDDEDYMKKVGYKLIELQRQLQSEKYVNFLSYQSRTTFAQTAYLRYFVCTVEQISNSLMAGEPSEEFLAVVRIWAKQDRLLEVVERFGMFPEVLENLLLIEAYGKIKKNQAWFTPAVTELILKNKFAIEQQLSEELVHRQRTPTQYLRSVETQIAQLPDSSGSGSGVLPLDISYDEHNSIISVMSGSFYVSQERFESQKVKVYETSEGKVKLQRKRDFATEQFVVSKENLLRKVMHSKVFSIFVNESSLKKLTGDILFSFAPTTQKNVVFYPFFADFILPSKKLIVQVRERNRLVDGVENTLSGFNQVNEEFLKMIGYRIVYVDHADFEIDYKGFQLNVLSKVFKAINPKVNS